MSARPMSVLIAVPSGKTVDAEMLTVSADLLGARDGLLKRLTNPRMCYVSTARNMAVATAQRLEADYLFFLDADMDVPAHAIGRLVSWQKDVIGACYPKRSTPHTILAEMLDDVPLKGQVGENLALEVKSVPAGCLLIRTSVFDRLKKPYFRLPFSEASGEEGSDDFDFCGRVRAAGLKVWCDLLLSGEVGHLGNESFKIGTHGV